MLRVRKTVLEKFEQAQSLSDASTELLEVLSAAAVVVNPSNLAVRATAGALAMGLLRNREILHAELVRLVDQARQSNAIEALDTEIITIDTSSASLQTTIEAITEELKKFD